MPWVVVSFIRASKRPKKKSPWLIVRIRAEVYFLPRTRCSRAVILNYRLG
jgi:hypothetical protein